jgi:microcystin-dependent protein
MNPYLGMIILFGGNFAINGWQLCNGQLLSISSNAALFSIIGTFYGGNGTSTFGLPDFRGRVPIHQGTGPGLNSYVVGESGGTQTVNILISNLPLHSHSASLSVTVSASVAAATANVPSVGTSTLGAPVDPYSGDPINLYNGGAPGVALNTLGTASGITGVTGSGLPISILQPYLTVTFLIALTGIFPTRN